MLSNGNDETVHKTEDGEASFKKKYRELKKRLKYLVYENECFENDIKESQLKLLQLGREKSFLLDQLMVHETIVLSDHISMESTDYSSEEERSSTYSEMVSRKPSASVPSKAPPPSGHTPSGSVITSSPKQPPVPRGSRANVTKKSATGRTSRQAASKTGTKTVSKTSSVPPTVNATPTLIVSLPINVGQTQPHPPKLIPTVSTKNSSPKDRKPSSIGGKDKGGVVNKRPSPPSPGSSSSGSSSSSEGSSDESEPGGVSGSPSDSTSDSEGEPMDTTTRGKPLPPPLLMDSPDVVMATSMPHPKSMESPIRIMAPHKLTSSLNTIPLLSPSVPATTKLLPMATATPTMGMTTPLTSPSPSIGNNPDHIRTFHIINQQGGVVSNDSKHIFNDT